ncbi:hypothetical protein PM10SUCC1_29060 [Propionigenium maris DSM 9537]|uniref:Uncharacterized protein n=1 Tax=Propionigenium maris DSM 9537 TaxID=1123000 RepID=A0A9W6LPA8_9FUSO|nr:hypothetical protein [Propionigenium maris]GLI57392.1 hypothetical protein PM10SUCC1_29060 [Propionigenium maris DSM 9537]
MAIINTNNRYTLRYKGTGFVAPMCLAAALIQFHAKNTYGITLGLEEMREVLVETGINRVTPHQTRVTSDVEAAIKWIDENYGKILKKEAPSIDSVEL